MLEVQKGSHDFYAQITREILLILRADRSQLSLSHDLGFSFNQVGKWEAGVTQFHWSDFIQLNEKLNIPWVKHFTNVFVLSANYSLENSNAFEILSQFFGHASVSEMAMKMNKSKSSISRLLHDQVKVDFADILRVMDQRPFVLTTWLAHFIDVKKLPSLQLQFESETRTLRGLMSVPWAPIVNAALQVAHDAKDANLPSLHQWIAKKTGLEERQVESGLQVLMDCGIIELRGERYFSLVKEMTLMRVPEFRKFTQFLTQRLAESFRQEAPRTPNYDNPSLTSTRIYPVSSAAGKKIAEALVLFHHQVGEILKNDKAPADHVRAIVIHCIDLEILSPKAKDELQN